MEPQQIHLFIIAYLRDEINAEDLARLNEWRQANPQHELTFTRLTEKKWLTANIIELQQHFPTDKAWEKISAQMSFAKPTPPRIFAMRKWLPAAAALILLLAAGWWLLQDHSPVNLPIAQQQRFKNDVPPGKTGAVLTLSDGSQVSLDDVNNGKLTDQGDAAVTKENGALAYNKSGTAGQIIYNTLHTPRGRKFKLQLSDGTMVWLNASSSITYPVNFPDSARNITLTGEAYFEVAKSSAPFKVKIPQVEIQVLGTHFNVMAYEDEALWRTTLIEGAVHVKGPKTAVLLTVGEQAGYDPVTQNWKITKPDLEAVLGWKNDIFYFENANIAAVMKQLVRWYDIEVVYETPVDIHFSGTLPRNVNISTILKTLESTKSVKFSIEGKKVFVSKPI
ncbi:FecR domain-containing protein [Chitinophaga pendula]|uniref:FecR family protein n=1 Tax=Chitinophaga pendula TaxID=2849666 RepID=UPI001CEDCEE6|nr:FecR domain-containing protein [Chitinophaga pendula]UCJ09119.1 FecR domain-containing protein [Chitinophaga pendula]